MLYDLFIILRFVLTRHILPITKCSDIQWAESAARYFKRFWRQSVQDCSETLVIFLVRSLAQGRREATADVSTLLVSLYKNPAPCPETSQTIESA